MPNDTDRDAETAQIELLRRATPTERLRVALDLSATVRQLSLRALRRSMPDADERELLLAFARLHYGDEIADELEIADWSPSR